MEKKEYKPMYCTDYQPKNGGPVHKGCGEEVVIKRDETGRPHSCECAPLTVLVRDPESPSGFRAVKAWVPHKYTCVPAREWYVGFRAQQKANRDEYFANKAANGGNFQKKQFNNGNYQKKPSNNSNYKQRAFTP